MTPLQPRGARCPATGAEFNSLATMLGRAGRVVERAPSNFASALRAPPSIGDYSGMAADSGNDARGPARAR
eukprot:7807076-Pyramimonas_sp.AAC.1